MACLGSGPMREGMGQDALVLYFFLLFTVKMIKNKVTRSNKAPLRKPFLIYHQEYLFGLLSIHFSLSPFFKFPLPFPKSGNSKRAEGRSLVYVHAYKHNMINFLFSQWGGDSKPTGPSCRENFWAFPRGGGGYFITHGSLILWKISILFPMGGGACSTPIAPYYC